MVEEEVDFFWVFWRFGLEFAPLGCEAKAVLHAAVSDYELLFVGVEDFGDGFPVVVIIDREWFIWNS